MRVCGGGGHGLERVVAPGGVVFAESAQFVLLLIKGKVVGMAAEGGLVVWTGMLLLSVDNRV